MARSAFNQTSFGLGTCKARGETARTADANLSEDALQAMALDVLQQEADDREGGEGDGQAAVPKTGAEALSELRKRHKLEKAKKQ